MRDPASSSTLPSKSSSVAGCSVLGHGLGSFVSSSLAVKSTSRRSAGSRDPGTCSSALKGKGLNSSQSFVDLFVPCSSPSQRVHLVDSVVQLSSSQDTHNMHGDMNSCGSVHGGDVHDNSSELHVNPCGALGHKNSCHVHAAEVRRGTKALSMSTRIGVGCPAAEKLASPQQAPGRLHDEVWASILLNQGPKIFREVEIVPGCAVTVACPSCPDHSPEPPEPGRTIRNMLGWSLEEKNVVASGYGCSVAPSKGRIFFLPLTKQETGKGRGRTTQRGRSLVVLHALVRMCTGEAPLLGHTLDGDAGHCLKVCGGPPHP